MARNMDNEIFRGPPTEDEAPEQENQPAEISLEASLQEQLQKQEDETQKNYDLYLRALAEVENIKKRSQREREEYLKYCNVTLIKKLLPVIDDLYRALDVAGKSKDYDGLSKGIEMTARKLDDLLKGEGVIAIESLGKPFDPQYHQALTVEVSDQHPENTVIEQMQTGYILHDRVLRPSLVKVSK
ncbi:MAG: nucleotide exchange factor GrpE [Syntrophomonas sp.]|nr:nucleotide exchange factor GrpE [Syntrophomonas sp.]